MAGPAWLVKPFTGPMSDTFAEHAARAPGYAFKGQDGAWSTPDDWNIVASHDGVVDLRYDRDYGNHIYIDGGGKDDDWGTLYGHLAKFHVEDGERVSANQSIGLMGATGNAKGIHLHHELRINGKQVDPAPYYVNDLPKLRRKRHTMSTLFYLGQKDGSFTYALAGDYPGGGAANWQEFQYMPGDDSVLGKVDDERIAALVDQHGQPVGLDLGLWQDKRELYTAPLGVPSATVDPVVIANAIVDEQAARLKPRR